MSILLAAASEIIKPDAPGRPTSQPSQTMVAALLGWTLIALSIAGILKVFRRQSIVGPDRLDDDDSALVPVLIFLGAFCAASSLSVGFRNYLTVDKSVQLLLINSFVWGMAFVFTLAAMMFVRDRSHQKFGLHLKQILPGFLTAIGTIFVLFPLVAVTMQLTTWYMHRAGIPDPRPHEVLQDLTNFSDKRLKYLAVAVAVIIAPFGEELAFRGILQTALGKMFEWIGDRDATRIRRGARWLAVIVTAAAFAAVHGEPAFFPALFVLAIGFGYVYERTGNLWSTIIAHAMFNSVQIFLFLHQ